LQNGKKVKYLKIIPNLHSMEETPVVKLIGLLKQILLWYCKTALGPIPKWARKVLTTFIQKSNYLTVNLFEIKTWLVHSSSSANV